MLSTSTSTKNSQNQELHRRTRRICSPNQCPPRVLGEFNRYPTEMLTLRSRLAENPFSMIQRSSRLVSILPVVVACMTMCSGCSSKHDGMTLVVAFPDSAAIEPGSPVEFNGANVGVVGNITLGDGELVVELLLNRDTRIPHAMAPVANHQRSANAQGSAIAFTPISDDDLSMIYADDTPMIDSPYVDGEYLAFGRVYDPQP